MQLEEISGVEDFARAARDLYAALEEIDQLQLGVDLAVKRIAGCDHASVSIHRRGRIFTPVGSDDLVRRGDALQYELDEGPCLEAVHSHLTVISQDFEREKTMAALDSHCAGRSRHQGRNVAVAVEQLPLLRRTQSLR